MNSKLNLYDALLGANVPADRARAVVEALEHEMYTVLATKMDLAAQARLFDERLERLRAEIRADLAREIAGLRLEAQAGDASLRQEMHALRGSLRQEMHALRGSLREEMHALGASLRDELHRGFDELRAADASIREEMRTGLADVRVEIARLAHTLTLRMGAGLAATAGVLVAAQQFL